MKKLLSLAAISLLGLTALADESASDLVFKFQNGTEQSIPAQNLNMKITDGSIIADNGVMNLNIPLESLQLFYFSATSGIEMMDRNDSVWVLYDLDGKCLGAFGSLSACQDILPTGIYVAKNETTTIKIAIR